MKWGWILGAMLSVTAMTSQAITVCHDYAFYRVTEWALAKPRDLNRLSPVTLKTRLHVLGYKRVAYLMPGETASLKKGDVIIIGDYLKNMEEDHSGFVTDDQGHIDHMIQSLERQDVPYTFEELQKAYDNLLKTPLVRQGWTITDLRERKRVFNGKEMDSIYRNKPFQVFRRTAPPDERIWVWVADVSNSPPAAPIMTLNVPLCTLVQHDPEAGLLKYERDVGDPDGKKVFTFHYTPVPKYIVEGEQVALTAKWDKVQAQSLLTDEAMIRATIRASGPFPPAPDPFVIVNTPLLKIRASLKDPAKVTTKTTDPATGKDIPDAPPQLNWLYFDWPPFDVNTEGMYQERFISVGTEHCHILSYRYRRVMMTLTELQDKRFPEPPPP